MKSFVCYDKKNKSIVCDDINNIPEICRKYFNDSYKSCKKHYEQIIKEGKICEKMCPYGFYTFFRENNIYTSIIIKDDNYNKIRDAYKYRRKKLKPKDEYYSKNQVICMIDDFEKMIHDVQNSRECMHELSNIGGYINSMISDINDNYREIVDDDDIKAMLGLYDMINYRISLATDISGIGYRKEILKTHPILDKLRIMMSYKARKKNVKIALESKNLYIEGSNNLYLALFIIFDNAIKNAPNNSEVNIYYGKITSEFVEIKIENRGPIIEKDELDKLIINNYRGVNTKAGGSGKGLAIFDKICKKAEYKYNISTKDYIKNENIFIVTIILKRKTEDEYNYKHNR